MSVLSINVGSIFPEAIRIGYEGENVVTQIDFNLKKWIAKYGLGGVTLLVLRHGDRDAYPVPLMIEDGIASWSITKTDTAKVGKGAIQLKYVAGEKIKKSPILDVSCLNALDDSDTVPDPYDSWLATLTDLSTLVTAKAAESLVNADIAQMAAHISAQAASQSAQSAETGATAFAQTASTKASEASTSAQSAASSAQTATDKATLATNKAQAASESATLATAKASAAATSETNAVTSAQTATAKASEAAASATSAQEYDESAQQSAVNAQTSATNAAASEANAQHYAENASAYLMTDTEATNLFDIAKGEA